MLGFSAAKATGVARHRASSRVTRQVKVFILIFRFLSILMLVDQGALKPIYASE
jgi:hypothetical protein